MSTCVLQGNLTADPELRYLPNGSPVVNFTVADTDRYRDGKGQWVDGSTVFMPVRCFGPSAEHIAEACSRGTSVVVTGRLSTRSWEDDKGGKHSRIECNADNVAVSLRTQRATVVKATRRSQADAPAA